MPPGSFSVAESSCLRIQRLENPSRVRRLEGRRRQGSKRFLFLWLCIGIRANLCHEVTPNSSGDYPDHNRPFFYFLGGLAMGCPMLAGGTIPFIRKYSTICP